MDEEDEAMQEGEVGTEMTDIPETEPEAEQGMMEENEGTTDVLPENPPRVFLDEAQAFIEQVFGGDEETAASQLADLLGKHREETAKYVFDLMEEAHEQNKQKQIEQKQKHVTEVSRFNEEFYSKIAAQDTNQEAYNFADQKLTEYLQQGMDIAEAVTKAGNEMLAQYPPEGGDNEQEMTEAETETPEGESMTEQTAAAPVAETKTAPVPVKPKAKPEQAVPTAASAGAPSPQPDYPTNEADAVKQEMEQRNRMRA